MKSLLLGVLFIAIIGIGGFVYRNAVEHPLQPLACPLDALVCPDGTSVGRSGPACIFPACPAPNVSLPEIGIAFAVPAGFNLAETSDEAGFATYESSDASSTQKAHILMRRYVIEASSTPLATIQQTAIGGASGLPVSATSYSSAMLGTHRFTVVLIERFEGVVDVAYYYSRPTDVLRFDAIDTGADWTNPNLDVTALPAQAALRKLLTTLQGG